MFESNYRKGQKKLLSSNKNEILRINSKILNSKSEKTNLSLFHYFIINAKDININLESVLKTFLSAGIDINQQSDRSHGYYSALHFAVAYPENLQLVMLLVENGIDIELKDENGNSALFNACFEYRGKKAQKDIIEFLSNSGSSLTVTNNAGISVIDLIRSLAESIDEGLNPIKWDLRQLNINVS